MDPLFTEEEKNIVGQLQILKEDVSETQRVIQVIHKHCICTGVPMLNQPTQLQDAYYKALENARNLLK